MNIDYYKHIENLNLFSCDQNKVSLYRNQLKNILLCSEKEVLLDYITSQINYSEEEVEKLMRGFNSRGDNFQIITYNDSLTKHYYLNGIHFTTIKFGEGYIETVKYY